MNCVQGIPKAGVSLRGRCHVWQDDEAASGQTGFAGRRRIPRVIDPKWDSRRKKGKGVLIGGKVLRVMKAWVMLEDDLQRIARFREVLWRHFPQATFDVSRTAAEFIARYSELRETPSLICLDHDLFPDSPEDPDPGDGRDVAAFLASQTPIAPVLIHSTNADAADSMLYCLLENGWVADRISPLGDDWIESYWFPIARDLAEPD